MNWEEVLTNSKDMIKNCDYKTVWVQILAIITSIFTKNYD